MELFDGQLKRYSSVSAAKVDWLWYPYIPFGKITLLQGDPGCGKSTLIMSIISTVSNGGITPDGRKLKRPMHVIYQCSEDGAADTIKPRLKAAGANCRNVAFLDEEMEWITLGDERIRRAIESFQAKLLVIDPVQAYLGDADISNATGMRKMLRQLAIWASHYKCAVVLIGHLNKKEGSKELYRSLGSIDIIAAARSVIQISASDDGSDTKVLQHIKSSLTPKGKDEYFVIDYQGCIRWLDQNEALSVSYDVPSLKTSKHMQAMDMILAELSSGPMKASAVQNKLVSWNLSERTLQTAKKELGVRSVRKGGVWYWELPNDCGIV